MVGGVIGALIGAVVVVLLLAFFVLAKGYRIPSSAMEPTLRCAEPGPGCSAGSSDRVAALRFFGPIEPDRGDLVAYETPSRATLECGVGGTFLSRVVVLPGETWRMEAGAVLVEGRRLDEPYLDEVRRGMDTQPARAVPPGHYVMLGDNRQFSCDSRAFGPVPRDNLIGEVVAVYWPPTRISIR